MPYHVNPETGNVFPRKAKKKCRFGSDSGHSAAADEGRTAYEKKVASLSTFHVHKGKIELLIPPGRHKVTGKLHDLIYTWDGGLSPSRKPDAETSYPITAIKD